MARLWTYSFAVASVVPTFFYRSRLRIGLADSLAQPRLTQLLIRCREEEPRTEVRIAEMTVNAMLQALRHEQIDVGFTVDGEATRMSSSGQLRKRFPQGSVSMS